MAARLPVLTPARVTVAPMRRRHLRSVLRIENLVYPRPWSMGLFLSELALRSTRSYLVARTAGGVAGYSGLMFVVDDAHVTTIAVDPEHQREKIGTRLLLVQAREAIRRGAEALTLEVRVSNHGAQELYRRFGFAPAGVRRNYYAENREDALVMWAHDIQGAAFRDRLDAIEDRLPTPTLVDPAVAAHPVGAPGDELSSPPSPPEEDSHP